MRRLATLLTFLAFANAVVAQDRPNTILVMDGSGSMWGQIDGVAKITIAQEVVGELLQSLPADESLGLVVYGHRARGDCSDIETVVAPGPNTRDAIAAAVNAISPLGKTPMTDSIIAAAEALRYTEDSATVILVSDGVETCNPDPCAAARLLEEAGVDFTAHVIGFDVGSDPEALAQMQCIADETGGKFLTAENASELSTALTEVVQEPEPVAQTGAVTFGAVEEGGFIGLNEPIIWQVTAEDGTPVITDRNAPGFTEELAVGKYTVSALRVATEDFVTAPLQVYPSPAAFAVTFPAPPLPQATITAPDSAPLGSLIPVEWAGPANPQDRVEIAEVGEIFLFSTNVSEGNPLTLQAPGIPGNYELRYMLDGSTVIATRPITVTEIPLDVTFPEQVGAGSSFDVTWAGPNASLDNVDIANGDGSYIDYAYTKDGNPVSLTAPIEPGTYDIRYRFLDNLTLVSKPITVVKEDLALDFPAEVSIGQTFDVTWTGPNADRDNIQIGPVGSNDYTDYTYTREGNPVQLVAPGTPGDYEIRYKFQDSETVLAQPITVTPLQIALVAPAEAQAGSTIMVGWTGPDADRDNIQIAEIGGPYIDYTYTRDGNPVQLTMPATPGEYELRYSFQDSEILFAQPITVTKVEVGLVAPATAVAGSTIPVGWTGPNADGDNVQVAEIGGNYVNYAYLRDGNPVNLVMPAIPGDYELRYSFQDSETIYSQPISITAVTAQLVTPPSVVTGGSLIVGWDGPDYSGDYIAIGRVGESDYVTYSSTNVGNPTTVAAPDTAGDYEVRYVMGQNNTVLATAPLTVTKP